jgi:hypothetical protein
MKKKILLFGMVLSLMTISCSKDKDDVATNMTSEEASANAKVDAASDDVANIVDDLSSNAAYGEIAGRSTAATAQYLPGCATVSTTQSTTNNITTYTRTVVFDANGCTMQNGNILKGTIIITFVPNPNAATHTVTYTFVNFYHNAIKLEGNKTFTRTMTPGTNSHPIVTMNMDMTATFPNGNVYTRVGTRIREIIAGYGDTEWQNNVYQITGNWSTTFPNGTTRYSTITSPLIIKLAPGCNHHFVQGIISFVQNDNTATLDYGDGTCDAIAIFTINGVAHTITLGN